MTGKPVVDASYLYPPQPVYIVPESPRFNDLDNDESWLAEVKYNGNRCLIRIGENNEICLWSRHKTFIEGENDIIAELKSLNLPSDSILDGEFMGRRDRSTHRLILFGILQQEGEILHLPFKESRAILDKLDLRHSRLISRPEYAIRNKFKLYRQAIKNGDEGIVIKSLTAVPPVSRLKAVLFPFWLKAKPFNESSRIGEKHYA